VRRVEGVGGNSGFMHQRIAVIIAALGRIGLRGARVEDGPIQVIVIGAFLRDGGSAGIARFLHAEEEGEPIRDVLSVRAGFVVVLNGTILPHVPAALAIAVLAGESPSSISVLVLIRIPVGERHEKGDLRYIIESWCDLSNGVFFTPWSQ